MLVEEFLEKSAVRNPEKTALVFGEDRLTYRDLDSRANRLAHALIEGGVTYGDRVVVFLDNSPETVISIFGILKAGAIFTIVNPSIKRDKLAYILNNCRAAALITHMSKWKEATAAVSQTRSLKRAVLVGASGGETETEENHILWDNIEGYPSCIPTRKTISIDLAALIYTSGTTGNPKGVMLTHRNMVSASTSITTYLENGEEDIILCVLPLSFDYGLYQIIMSAQFGGTVILEKTFIYPYAVVEILKKEKVTGFPIVPTISAILMQMKELEKERFDHLRFITNTAAALPISHIKGLKKIFPTAKLYSMYGLTECKRVSYLPPEELDTRPTSVGKGMPDEQVYLVREDNSVITERDIVGELVVRGPNVMKGYWELPEETEQVLRPGRYPWERVLYTGDLFKMDEEGFLYFVSRKDDIIKSRGEKVSPKEIEAVLYDLSDVVEAAVVGIPDEILGESIKAYIVLKKDSPLTGKDIISYCAGHLEDFMVPKTVELRDNLPKTSTGKITKKGL